MDLTALTRGKENLSDTDYQLFLAIKHGDIESLTLAISNLKNSGERAFMTCSDKRGTNFGKCGKYEFNPYHPTYRFRHLDSKERINLIYTASLQHILHLAVGRGNIDIVELLINELGLALNCRDSEWNLPIHVAIMCNNADMVEFLLRKDFNVLKERGHFSRPTLVIAALSAYPDLFDQVLRELTIHFPEKDYLPHVIAALHYAVNYGIYYPVKRILFKFPDLIEARNEERDTPLISAALSGDVDMMQYLIFSHKANINAHGKDKLTALMAAAAHSNVKAVKFLLAMNADPLATMIVCHDETYTALHVASGDIDFGNRSGCLEVVKALIDFHPDLLNIATRHGRTPLHTAVIYQRMDIVKFFVEETKINLNAKDYRGYSAVHDAVSRGDAKLVKFFVENGADLNDRGSVDFGTYLHYAVTSGRFEMVKIFLDLVPEWLESCDFDENTPLHLAASYARLEIMQYLIDEKGANIEAVDTFGNTPLMNAVQADDLETVRFLIARGANTRVRRETHPDLDFTVYLDDPDELSLAHIACRSEETLIINHLLQSDPSIGDEVTRDGDNLLCYALAGNQDEIAKYLIKSGKVDLNAKNKHGKTPLMLACRESSASVVKLLLKHGADVYATCNRVEEYGALAIHFAIEACRLDIVKLLLKTAPDLLEATNLEDDTPLIKAAMVGSLEIVAYLVERHADLEATEESGWTPFLAAVANGHLDIVEYLLQQGAELDVFCADEYGSSPIHLAVTGGSLAVVASLLEKRPDWIEATDLSGNTPLSNGCCCGHLDIVRYLVEKKNANIEAVGQLGRTPLALAISAGSLSITEYLIDRGADLSAVCDEKGGQAIHLAAASGNCEIVASLLKINPEWLEAKDKWNNTPLWCACLENCLEVVRFLVEIKNADMEARGSYGWTPLLAAGYMRRKEVAEYLVNKGANIYAFSGDGTSVFDAKIALNLINEMDDESATNPPMRLNRNAGCSGGL